MNCLDGLDANLVRLDGMDRPDGLMDGEIEGCMLELIRQTRLDGCTTRMDGLDILYGLQGIDGLD